MKKLDDIIGKTIGNTQILSFDHRDESYSKYYKCKCIICGSEFVINIKNILADPHFKCRKCKYSEKAINDAKSKIGEKYGNLEIIDFIERKFNVNYFKCKCTCGNIETVRSTELNSGKFTEDGQEFTYPALSYSSY